MSVDEEPTTRSPSKHDDSVGHYTGGPGSVLQDRYRLVREVGLGTFGRVVECVDLMDRRSTKVAIKIVRNVKRYHESALIEAKVLRSINSRGGRGVSHCVYMYEHFTFSGHLCIVFEELGPSLYDFSKQQNHRPFPMICIQDFTIQLLETLEFLHGIRLIHTDLKVENILLFSDRQANYHGRRIPQSTRIKVIDFGGACYNDEKKSSIINTRQFRAPEVILQTGWSMPSDMWSLGCILAELYIGELLFATHDNLEHLALIERVVGRFPRRMLKRAREESDVAREAFGASGLHRLGNVLPAESLSYVKQAKPLELLSKHTDDDWFVDLLRMILVIDPKERATAHECLRYLSSIRMDRCNAL